MSRTFACACLLAAALVASGTSLALAETQATPVAQTASPDFGSPPSGEIPILYNDRHVYAKPDLLKQGRVLAAYAKDGTIYLPLRSMFEQMLPWHLLSRLVDSQRRVSALPIGWAR